MAHWILDIIAKGLHLSPSTYTQGTGVRVGSGVLSVPAPMRDGNRAGPAMGPSAAASGVVQASITTVRCDITYERAPAPIPEDGRWRVRVVVPGVGCDHGSDVSAG